MISNKQAWWGWAEAYLAEDEGAVDVAAFFSLLAHEAPGRRVALALLDVEAHEGPALLLVRRLDVRARVAALQTQAHGKRAQLSLEAPHLPMLAILLSLTQTTQTLSYDATHPAMTIQPWTHASCLLGRSYCGSASLMRDMP